MKRVRGSALLLLALAAVVVGSMPAAALAEPRPTHPARTGPLKSDSDGNRLFDDLEVELAGADASDRSPVIVRLTESPSNARLADIRSTVGRFDVERMLPIVDGFAAALTTSQIRALARHPRVRSVEADSVVRASNGSAQESFGVAAARADANLEGDADSSAGTYSAADLVAAVIDTGIDARHVDLDGGKVLAFVDFVNGRTDAYDDNGHGTHVAATIAGDGDGRSDRAHKGVAPGAALIGLKVLDASGNGSMSNVTAAIDWAVANRATYGIEVLNLSLGTTGCADGTDATSQAVNRAHAAGLVVVVAAGNSGPGTCTIGSPGAAAGALTVGAMADTGVGGFHQAYFSSRGPTLDGRIKPDVSAPGVNITSAATNTGNGYTVMSGTSMATPFTAGVALLMREANPSLAAQAVKDAITGTAIDWGRGGNGKTVGSTGNDIDYGAGRLDAYAAIRAAGAPISTALATPAHALVEGNLSSSGAYVDHYIRVEQVGTPLAATLIIPGLSAGSAYSPDFDLYLYDPSGVLVARAETTRRQEFVSHVPTKSGDFRLRVRSYSGSGGYFADLSFGGPSTSPTPSPSPSPSPTTVTAFPKSIVRQTGSYRSGSTSSLSADDDSFYGVDSTTSGTRTTSWYGSFTGISNALTSLKVSYKGKQSSTATQVISLYRWSDSTWVQLDSRSVGSTEVLVADLVPAGTLASYVSGSSGDGELRVRIRSTRSDGSFTTRADLLKIVFVRP